MHTQVWQNAIVSFRHLEKICYQLLWIASLPSTVNCTLPWYLDLIASCCAMYYIKCSFVNIDSFMKGSNSRACPYDQPLGLRMRTRTFYFSSESFVWRFFCWIPLGSALYQWNGKFCLPNRELVFSARGAASCSSRYWTWGYWNPFVLLTNYRRQTIR